MRKWRIGILIILCVILSIRCLFVFRQHTYIEIPSPFEALVIDEPDVRETHTKLTVLAKNQKILLLANSYPKFNYGDHILVEGKIQPIENFNDFDYKSYLAKDEIYLESFRPSITLIDHDGGNKIKKLLFSFKNWFLNKLATHIPEPESSLAGGLIVGAKQSLGTDLLDKFRIVGLIHLVVLSGANVMIVANFIMYIFKFLPKNISFGLGVVAIILFAVMTGGGAATIRASIMAIISLIARKSGRSYSASTALIFAGFIMVFLSPKILVFDVGFQLSFLATLGLIYLSPVVEHFLKFVPVKFGLREILVTTISAQIAVTPWILYTIGNISLVSIIANLLVLPSIPFAMLFGFLVLFLATPFAWIAYMFLAYIVLVVELFSKIPFASLTFTDFPLWATLSLYAFIIGLWYHYKKHVVTSPNPNLLTKEGIQHDQKN